MTVYGPRLYFGPLDTPDGKSPDSSCSRAIIEEPPTEKEHHMPETLTWNRQSPGWYRADLDAPETGVLRWEIVNTESRRWEIISITTGMERRRHGAAYTLREAREVVGNFHTSNCKRAAVTA